MSSLLDGLNRIFSGQRGLAFVALLLLLFGVTGCSGSAAKQQMLFKVTSSEDLNNGQPVCLVIRNLTKQDFLVRGYEEIADMVYAIPQDESLLAWRMIIPGDELEFEIEQPEKDNVGIYGLYTNPEGAWKVLINPPVEEEYQIILNRNSLSATSEGSSIWPF